MTTPPIPHFVVPGHDAIGERAQTGAVKHARPALLMSARGKFGESVQSPAAAGQMYR
jgi:hypothetical protein